MKAKKIIGIKIHLSTCQEPVDDLIQKYLWIHLHSCGVHIGIQSQEIGISIGDIN